MADWFLAGSFLALQAAAPAVVAPSTVAAPVVAPATPAAPPAAAPVAPAPAAAAPVAPAAEAAPAATPPPVANLAHPPKVSGSPGAWVSFEDYPTQSLRMGEQGTVHFLLTVDETGAPLTCEVTGSSGSAELDNATCKLVQRRAKFTPAADKSGAPTVGYYFNSARWFIPEAKVAPDASELTVSYVVNADGVPGACTVVTQAGEAAAKWARKLSLCPTVAYDQPYRGAQGQPIAQKVTVTLKINVADGQ